MRAIYREYDGGWTQESLVDEFPVTLTEDEPGDRLDEAERILLDSANNCTISFFVGDSMLHYIVCSGAQSFRYEVYDGVDFKPCSRDAVLAALTDSGVSPD